MDGSGCGGDLTRSHGGVVCGFVDLSACELSGSLLLGERVHVHGSYLSTIR